VAHYGQAYKNWIVARLLPPESLAVELVSRETGLSLATLKRWRADALGTGSGGSIHQTAAARRPMKKSWLTVSQSRLLRRVSEEGLSHRALKRKQGYGICAQIRSLRILCAMGLVIETRSDKEILFELTDAGRELAQLEAANAHHA
jgi:hypothetical protein